MFYLRWYPFDSQTCYMVILMEGNTGKFVELVDDFIEYTGPKELTQYFVKKTDMRITNFGQKMGVLVVSLTLGRRLMGTILTVFLPTVLLNLIGHATNFFKAFFFEAVVTVNLTGKTFQIHGQKYHLICSNACADNDVHQREQQLAQDLLHQDDGHMAHIQPAHSLH